MSEIIAYGVGGVEVFIKSLRASGLVRELFTTWLAVWTRLNKVWKHWFNWVSTGFVAVSPE
jgi:hypothetical protein